MKVYIVTETTDWSLKGSGQEPKLGTYEMRHLSEQQALAHLEAWKWWDEHYGHREGEKIEMSEREEDLVLYEKSKGVSVWFPKTINLKHYDGTIAEVELNRERIGFGKPRSTDKEVAFDLTHAIIWDSCAFNKQHEYDKLANDKEHIIHDAVLVGMDEIQPGIWSANYEIIAQAHNLRIAIGTPCLLKYVGSDKYSRSEHEYAPLCYAGCVSIPW